MPSVVTFREKKLIEQELIQSDPHQVLNIKGKKDNYK